MAGPGTPINNIFNEPEIDAQVKRVLAQLGTVADGIVEVQKLIESTKGAQTMVTLTKAIEAMGAATDDAKQATLKLKTEEEQLTVTISKVAAAQDDSNKKMSETEKLAKLYDQTLAKLNASLSTEAELAMQAKVALGETSKQLKDQAKQALGLVGAYDLLQAEFKDLSTKAKDMAVIWGVNSTQAKEASAAALEVNNKLKLIDASVGNFQRNVGNYASGFQNFNQVLREMPNFAISATTGIQSLSNNLPMLQEEIKRARDAGMSWNQVLQTVGKSIFGWGGLVVGLTIAFTALPKILQALESDVEKVTKKFKSFAEVQKMSEEATVKEKVGLEAYLVIARDRTKTDEERNAAIKKINDIMPDYLGKIKLEEINTQATIDKLKLYVDQLNKKALFQAYQTKLQDLYVKKIEIENSAIEDNIGWYEKLWIAFKNGSTPSLAAADAAAKGVLNRKAAAAAVNDEIDALTKKRDADIQSGKAVADLDKITQENTKTQSEAADKTQEFNIKELKNLFEANKSKLEAAMSASKTIRDNEQMSYDARYAAATEYYAKQQELSQLQRDFEVKQVELREKDIAQREEVIRRNKKLSPQNKSIELANLAAERKANNAELLKIDADYQKASVENEISWGEKIAAILDFYNKKVADADKKAQEEKKKAREDKNNGLIANLETASIDGETQLNKKLLQLNNDFLSGKLKNVEDYERKKAQLEIDYAKVTTEAQIKAVEALLQEGDFATKEQAKYEKQLSELKLKLSKLVLDGTKKHNKEAQKDLLTILQTIQTAVSNISQSISNLASIGFDRRQAELETEKTLIEKNSAAELKKIQDSTLSQQDQAAAIIKLEAQKQTQIEENDRKRRKLDTERARFERLNSIAGIITGTSLAVVGALKNPGGFLGLALAATFGALGLAQLTKALSAPIPKYKHGTDWHKGGLAVVGDGGRKERVILPGGGQFDTADKPTIMNLPAGTKVLPDADKINRAMIGGMRRTDGSKVVEISNRDLIDWQTKQLLRGMEKNKPKIVNKTTVNLGRDFYLFKNVFE